MRITLLGRTVKRLTHFVVMTGLQHVLASSALHGYHHFHLNVGKVCDTDRVLEPRVEWEVRQSPRENFVPKSVHFTAF